MNYNLENLDELPLFAAGWSAGKLGFDEAEDFWSRVLEVTEEGGIASNLDDMLEGRSAPRIWLLLHEPGQGALTAAAALGLARQLTSRQQATLILDADEVDCSLTRWIDKEEQEGWIDMVRYGSSVLANGEALPFPGRTGYVLGVGSFTPTDATTDEIHQLLGRLRRQADDILVVAQADELGRRWAAAAQIRLFCWDRQQRNRGVVDALARTLAQLNCPLTGLVGFGLPDEEPQGVVADSAVEETDTTELVAAAEPETETETEPEIEPVAAEADMVDESEPAAEDEASPAEPAEAPTEWTDQDDDEAEPRFETDPEFAHRRSNSGIFWGAAVVSVALILAVGFYYVKYLRVPPEGNFSRPPVHADAGIQNTTLNLDDPSATEADPGATDMNAGQDDGGSGDLSHLNDAVNLPPEAPTGETGSASTDSDQAAIEAATTEQPDRTGETPATTITEQPAPRQDMVPAPEPDGPQAQPAATEPRSAPVFDPEPYIGTVGEAGYALHVYSFSDSTQAGTQQQRLQRMGIRSVSRTVQMDTGRWWRIYVGNFATSGEAREAKPALLAKLHEDWAQITPFK